MVKPWRARFEQRTALELIVHVTAIGPTCQLRPLLSVTGWLATKESWLRRASVGRPTEPMKTKPGSPMPAAFGAGTTGELHSSCIGGVFGI